MEGWQALLNDEIVAGDVVVIRYEGPKGSPGMPHLETFMAAVCGKKLDEDVALITDGRFSGATRGLAIDPPVVLYTRGQASACSLMCIP